MTEIYLFPTLVQGESAAPNIVRMIEMANTYDDIDKIAYHFIVYDGEKPVATARLYGNENPYHIGRVAVIREYRGKGIGAYVMNEVEKFAKEQGISSLVLSAQVRASDFYRKCGYKEFGNEYMDEFCPHIDMMKIL